MEVIIVGLLIFIGLGVLFGWIAFFQLSGLRSRVEHLETEMKSIAKKEIEALKATQPEKTKPKVAAKTIVEPKKASKSKVDDLSEKLEAQEAGVNAKADLPSKSISEETQAKEPVSPPKEAVVFTPENKEKLTKWFAENWAYALGALSLALAGIYIVRLGMEHGYFPPVMRVLSGAGFGAALIAVADWLRRKGGDEKGSTTEYIPSTVASAGFATLFASVLGAYTLYGLIGASTSFAGLALVAVFAIVSGWRFGALLSALGVAGAFLAPMMVSEGSDSSYIMFAYALLILAMTLAIDTIKRTGWLSVWAMAASFVFAFMVYIGQSVTANADFYGMSFLGFGLVYLLLCTIIPERKLNPDMGAGGILILIFGEVSWPSFPARLVGGAMAVNLLVFLSVSSAWLQGFWPIMVYVSLLAAICFFWLGQTAVLEEYAFIPLGMTLVLLVGNLSRFTVASADSLIAICLFGLVLALLCALAAQVFKQLNNLWRFVSIGYPFAFAALLMANWSMGNVLPYWQLIVGAYVGLTAYLAYHYARKLGRDAAIVDISVIAIWGYVVMLAWSYLSELPLVLALGLIVVPLTFGALKMNWRFHELAAKIWTGFAVFFAFSQTLMGGWAELAALVMFAFGAIALYFQCGHKHPKMRIHFEAWAFVLASVSAAKMLHLGLDAVGVDSPLSAAGLMILVFMAQIVGIRHRMQIEDGAEVFRNAMLWLYIMAAALVAFGLFAMLPVLGRVSVLGIPFLNDMLIGYLAPALALIAIHKFQPWPRLRLDYIGFGIIALWFIMVVRHFWQGSMYIGLDQGTGSGELYSYSVMMLIAMAASMAKAVKERSVFWRRVAYALIILTSIKLYFVDLVQFEGVLRVVALFVFGVILIGFNFIDRKSMMVQNDDSI